MGQRGEAKAAPDYYAAGAQDPGRGQHYPLVPLARCPSPRHQPILRQLSGQRKLIANGRLWVGSSRHIPLAENGQRKGWKTDIWPPTKRCVSKLHCPWCGDGLVRHDSGELVCAASGMGLSQDLERRLSEVFVYDARLPQPSPFDGIDKWYCAGCGKRLERGDDGSARCPDCGRTMGEFSYQLIEFHPHEAP